MLTNTAIPPASASTHVVRTIAIGGLVVGTLDILEPLIFFGLRGTPPVRLLQGIASGLLGRAAFDGGVATALLGLLIHFCIATVVVAVYAGASSKLPVLLRHPVVYGAAYGISVYFFMQYVVLPLSAVQLRPLTMVSLMNGLFAHVFCVGLPAALVARRSSKRSRYA
jgi:uncharacterized membrane protein YagU involved in acid resistance